MFLLHLAYVYMEIAVECGVFRCRTPHFLVKKVDAKKGSPNKCWSPVYLVCMCVRVWKIAIKCHENIETWRSERTNWYGAYEYVEIAMWKEIKESAVQ